jgi:hypothetical protein
MEKVPKEFSIPIYWSEPFSEHPTKMLRDLTFLSRAMRTIAELNHHIQEQRNFTHIE